MYEVVIGLYKVSIGLYEVVDRHVRDGNLRRPGTGQAYGVLIRRKTSLDRA
jgi:hypothetical protein